MVPREQQRVRRVVLGERLRWPHREVRARRELVLLRRSGVAHELHQLRTDTAEVRHRGALRGRAVTHDAVALRTQAGQELHQVVPDCAHPVGEALQHGEFTEAGAAFLREQLVDRRGAPARSGTRECVTDLTAVHGKAFHVDQFEVVPAGHLVDGARAEEEEMLVVDLVEGRALDDVTEVGVLEHEHAVRLQQCRDSPQDRRHVRDVAQGVGRVDDVGLPLGVGDVEGRGLLEEVLPHPNALPGRQVGHGARGFHPQVPDPRVGHGLQHGAVVATQFDDERVLSGQLRREEPLGQRAEVLTHHRRAARQVRIVLVEHLLARYLLRQLHHAARSAQADREPEGELLRHVGGVAERVRQGLGAEVEELGDRGTADPAVRCGGFVGFGCHGCSPFRGSRTGLRHPCRRRRRECPVLAGVRHGPSLPAFGTPG